MGILKRYILKEHVKPFLFGLFIFVFILFMGNIGDVIRMMLARQGEFFTVMRILGTILIYVASFSIPMACLLAVLLAVGRFNSDNEIIAMRACGLNPARLMVPVFIVAALISVFSIRLNGDIVPRATTQTERLLADFAAREPSMFIQERTLIEDFEGHMIYVQGKKDNRLFGVQITQLREKGFPVNISSREGRILSADDPGELRILLIDGTLDEAEDTEPYRYSRSRFERYYISLSLPETEKAQLRRRPKDMTITELREKAAELESMNMDSSPLVSEINVKIAQSFAPVAFVLVAVPLSLKIKKGGKSVGFGLCLILVILYYVLFTATQTLAERNIADETIIWMPNILLALGGLALLSRRE